MNISQKQINKNKYEEYKRKKEEQLEKKMTETYLNTIKTKDLGLVTFLITKGHNVIKVPTDIELWSIQKLENTDSLYESYKNGMALVNPKVFGKTLLNLLDKNPNSHEVN